MQPRFLLQKPTPREVGCELQGRRVVLQVVGDGQQLAGAAVEYGRRNAAKLSGRTLPRLERLDRG
jgi:hypothetical protein